MPVNVQFISQLNTLQKGRKPENRRWVFLCHDQLSRELEPLRSTAPAELAVVFLENRWWARRRPYHVMKLAHVWANQRHFALELARAGVWVDYRFVEEPFAPALRNIAREHSPLEAVEPAERETRLELQILQKEGVLRVIHPHSGWLTTAKQFQKGKTKSGGYLMDSFYRQVRKDTGILMESPTEYVGGKVSFDTENRLSWEKGKDPEPPKFPTFAPDSITREVLETLRTEYADHPGYLDEEAIPATLPQAESYWAFFLQELLPHFGPYEDAMTIHSTALFHSKVSTLLNLTRLMPERLIRDVEHSQAPLQCREGFIRQILGWREFVRHVHLETDGFRQLPGGAQAVAATPGDGGYERWNGKSWKTGTHIPELDGGSVASYLDAEEPLPPAWWGSTSGLHCLDTVVESVWKEGWSHHITRLMVLSNIATLLDISPRELTDWFWVAYSDAWDWVVEPNVMGMGTYGVGPLFTTKPYIAGSAYIDKMSDYCNGCRFKPGSTCPLPQLYWAFLARHQDKLEKNPRLSMPYASLKKRSAAKRQEDERIFESVRSTLQKGESLGTGELF